MILAPSKKNKTIQLFSFLLLSWILLFAVQIEARSMHKYSILGSMNPVGSGARSLGFGGAFIGVADDATAASWNPGGEIQLEKSEVSIVHSSQRRKIKLNFTKTSEASGQYPISLYDINFASVAYKMFWKDRDFVFSLCFQNMYDMNKEEHALYSFQQTDRYIVQHNTGYINAVTPSFAFQLTPEISMGIAMNLFSDDWGSRWETKVKIQSDSRPYGKEWWSDSQYYNEYQFKGKNVHIGFLIALSQNLNLGLVYKSAFTAELDFKEQFQLTGSHQITPLTIYPEERLDLKMPQSYGMGIAWRPDYKGLRDSLTLAFDIYRTDWQHYYLKHSDGYEENLLSYDPLSECNTRPTHQVHIGAEYWYYSNTGKYAIPFRMGAFYDPEPTSSNPDDFWGISLGTGFLKGSVAFDVAWQFRWGDHVRKTQLFNEDVFQDIRQHTIYCSIIYYFQSNQK